MRDGSRTYREQKKLLAQDVDFCNKWKMASIFSTAQDVANGQCNTLQCGWQDLYDQYRACYVLTRMRFEMEQYPGSGETVSIYTWPAEQVRVIFTRYFRLEGEDGRHLGSATSQWVLFHQDNRSILKPDDCNIEMPTIGETPPAPVTLPRFTQTLEPRHSMLRTPVYSDFDYNGHVNNSRYMEWICDLLGKQRFLEKRIKMIDIKYTQEIRDVAPLTMQYGIAEETGSFFVRGKNEENGISHFEACGEMM